MGSRLFCRGIWILVGVVVPAILLSVSLRAESLTAGNSPITLAIGTAAGGGYDQYARLAARYLQRDLPGNPTVVVKNMTGASGVLVLNWAYKSAPRDGTAIISATGSSVLAPFQGVSGAQYDPRKFNWLISLGNLTNVLIVWHTSSVRTIDDVMKKGMVLGNGAVDTAIIPAMLNRLIGTRFKIIAGYPGTNAVSLAMERGEVDGTLNLEWSALHVLRPEWLTENKIRILMQVTFHPIPELKNVPVLNDFIRDNNDHDMMRILLAKQDIGRPILAPPGVSPGIVAMQRAVFEKLAKDPEFLAEAGKMRLDIDPTPGPELAALVDQVYSTPEATVKRLHSEMKLAEQAIVKR